MVQINFSPRSYVVLANQIYTKGEKVSPRGKETMELRNVCLWTDVVEGRIVTDPTRRMNIGFAIAEWLSIMAGIDDIQFFQAFIKDYGRYSSNGISMDNAYGSRVREASWSQNGQIEDVIEILKADQASRNAIVMIRNANDSLSISSHIPCTLSLQFMIRNDKLEAYTNMRSNDVYLGLPYDWFAFTMVQEYIARRLGVPLGRYHHNAASLHLYAEHYPFAIAQKSTRWPYKMLSMPDDITAEQVNLAANLLLKTTQEVMNGKLVDCIPNFVNNRHHLGNYLAQLTASAMSVALYRVDAQPARSFLHYIEDRTLRHMTMMRNNWQRPPKRKKGTEEANV